MNLSHEEELDVKAAIKWSKWLLEQKEVSEFLNTLPWQDHKVIKSILDDAAKILKLG